MLRSWLRLLTFRADPLELGRLETRALHWGLLATSVVGMGRWWDDPGAHLAQKLGLGSVVYVFVVSLLFWLIGKGLRARAWSYRRVCTFVALTAPPAMLYAIPVERFLTLAHARDANMWFLIVVAAWRVALLVYAYRLHGLTVPRTLVGTLLPLTFVVATLTVLNLERVVFNVMGGFREPRANDGAYLVLLMLTMGSYYAFIPLVAAYIALAVDAWPGRRSGGPDDA
jgi:hypothetical protein